MPTIEVKIANQILRLECDNPAELQKAVTSLNEQIECIRRQSGTVGDVKIISIVAITLQDQLLKVQKRIQEPSGIDADNEDSSNIETSYILKMKDDLEKLASKLQDAVED
jgi:cell division protein ZapA (FtsZ GTPase activity inhibitor)